MAATERFIKTERQREALEVINTHRHTMLFGGSRSGKTVLLVRSVFLRAVKRASRHLIVRCRYNHARQSLGHETIPWVLSRCFPGLKVVENKADGFYTLQAGDGGTSEVWLGGTDTPDRVDKVLGNEYSTIYANECSEIDWEVIPTLWTRLAQNSGLTQRMFYDCNPPGDKHWTNLMFNQGTYPDGEKHGLDVGVLQVNPMHNQENLSPEYLQQLHSLPKRHRLRFLEGKYLKDVDGALWTDQMIVRAKTAEKEPGELRKAVVAVDPSVSNNPGSDECGIVVVGATGDELGVVLGDLSGKMSTRKWAERVVAAYHAFEANEVVAEKNNGGTLVSDAIHAIDPFIPVVLVNASRGKVARAEPVSLLYDRGLISHRGDFPKLEAELTETVFDKKLRQSPNRLDALVHGFTHLFLGQATRSRYHFA